MQSAMSSFREFFQRDGALVLYPAAFLVLLEIGGKFGILAGLGATLGLIAIVVGIQVLNLRYRKPARFRAGPKSHWRHLRAEKEAAQAEDIQNIVLSVIPLVVFMPFVALAASLDSISRFLAG